MSNTPITQGTQKQFDHLFRRSQAYAYRLAYRLTGNSTEAEDVVQDAYIRAWRNFARYDFGCSFEGWLYRIITNRTIDLHRRKKRVRLVSLDTVILGQDGIRHLPEPATYDTNPEQIILDAILEERLQAALNALPLHYRTPILLGEIEQYSYQEIADVMCCSVGTVRSRIHRGRQLLRGALTGGNSRRRTECQRTHPGC